jgi:ribosomal protein S18 acetylase RimI-like enzyme
MSVIVRRFSDRDLEQIAEIHDAARREELKLAGLDDAFLPFSVCAERENLFGYEGLFVAEAEGRILGFAACSEEELAWLYVLPSVFRKGVGSSLISYLLKAYPEIRYAEVLKGNFPAAALYERMGFSMVKEISGAMPGNERFPVRVLLYERNSQTTPDR